MKRLEAIACDAELQEKPLADLRKLGELLKERCLASVGEQQAQKENENEDSNLSGIFNLFSSILLGQYWISILVGFNVNTLTYSTLGLFFNT